jgi:prolipoprotein diacylglyceryltransferase
MTSVLLNAIYDAGNVIGEVSAYGIAILMAIVLIWVMFRYLNTKDLHD